VFAGVSRATGLVAVRDVSRLSAVIEAGERPGDTKRSGRTRSVTT
jgi:hypothetical protein